MSSKPYAPDLFDRVPGECSSVVEQRSPKPRVVGSTPTSPAKHDPGGKVKTALPIGMTGGAVFYGQRDEYRPSLWRYWGNDIDSDPYILWIGMNPSTADGEGNDPTITREIGFTREFGFSKYVKCNVLDYRATNQSDLVKPGVAPRSDRNVQTIQGFARDAELIIVCYGVLHPSLQVYAAETVRTLERDGHKLHCLGTTLFGHPRHPLYLKADTKPVPYIYAEKPAKFNLQKGKPAYELQARKSKR